MPSLLTVYTIFLFYSADVGLLTSHSPVSSSIRVLNSRFCRVTGIISTTSNPQVRIIRSRIAQQLGAFLPLPPAIQIPMAGIPKPRNAGCVPGRLKLIRRSRSRKVRILSLSSPKYTGLAKTTASADFNFVTIDSKSSSMIQLCSRPQTPHPSLSH